MTRENRTDVAAKRSRAYDVRRKKELLAEKARVEAHDLEKHADTLMRTAATTQAEAMRFYARAAALRRESDTAGGTPDA